jgi:4-hydroxy-tetrahydrodipicolinate synthase
MRQPIFTGACVAIVTPFNEQGVNFDALGALIEAQIAGGTNAICICGTTGEASTQTFEEHIASIRYCAEKVAGRVKVIAGTGANNTQEALYLSQAAEDCGVDGLLLVTPYYNKATQTGLIKHYTYIADRVNTPIILYNVPGRTGTTIQPATYKELAQHPLINGCKEASGSFDIITHTRASCPEDFYMWSGNDDQVVAMMSLGAKGVISVVSNVWPQIMAKMTALCLEGKFAEAAQIQKDIIPLCDALFCEVNPIPVKNALNMMGMNAGELRLPLCDMSDAHMEQMKTVLTRYGLLK